MFRFEDPIYLYALAVIPLLALIRWLMVSQQKKRLRRLGDKELLKQLMPDVSRFRPLVKFTLLLAVLALIIVMVARPQFGTKISHEKRSGIETIIALDISNSMLAEDVAPSRLDRSKMMVENLVDNFTNDKIGLIVFAGDAFIQLPITSDYVSAKMFLSGIEPSLINVQGTDIAKAINMASHSFTQEEGIGKAIIVITDGEDHEGGALEAARDAKERGMRVYVLGVGSPKGAPIPIGNGDYMKDAAGQTVMTGLNEQMCREVAMAGGGAYIHVENNSRAQEQLDNELDKLAKKETNTTVFSDYDEQFQAVGLIALLLLIIETCINEIKNPMLRRISLFKRGERYEEQSMKDEGRGTRIVLLFLLLSASLFVPQASQAQNDRQLIRQGNKVFRQGNFADAEVAYRKAVEKNVRNPQANYNLGTALLRQHKDSAAVSQLEAAAKQEDNPIRRAQAYHNMGVVCQQRQMFGEAIEAYKEALRNNPKDDETRYNLELCKRQQKQQQQNQQNQDNKDQQQQKDKEKEKQQQEQQKQEQQKKEQQQQEKKQQMSKENAEQMLNAAIQDEKQTQERMKKQQQQPNKRRLEKNW